jgi:hypothetical protein
MLKLLLTLGVILSNVFTSTELKIAIVTQRSPYNPPSNVWSRMTGFSISDLKALSFE